MAVEMATDAMLGRGDRLGTQQDSVPADMPCQACRSAKGSRQEGTAQDGRRKRWGNKRAPACGFPAAGRRRRARRCPRPRSAGRGCGHRRGRSVSGERHRAGSDGAAAAGPPSGRSWRGGHRGPRPLLPQPWPGARRGRAAFCERQALGAAGLWGGSPRRGTHRSGIAGSKYGLF